MRLIKWVPLTSLTQLVWLPSGIKVKRFNVHPSEDNNEWILLNDGEPYTETEWRVLDNETGDSVEITEDKLSELRLKFFQDWSER